MLSKEHMLENFLNIERPVIDISSKKLLFSYENHKLRDIINKMLSNRLRKIPVIDKSRHLKGLVTSVDLLDLLGGGEKYSIFKKHKNGMDMCVDKFMTKHVMTIHHKTSIKKSLEIFKILLSVKGDIN